MKVAKVLATQSCPDCSRPGSSVHGILQARINKYWSGLPFPSSGDLPDPRIKPGSPSLGQILSPAPPGKPVFSLLHGIPLYRFTKIYTLAIDGHLRSHFLSALNTLAHIFGACQHLIVEE